MSKFFQKISRAGLVLALIGGVLLGVSVGDTVTSFKPARSFEDVLESGAAPGDHVAGQVPFLLDSFASMQTWTENSQTHSTTPKKTSSRYYVLPGGEGFLGLTVHAKSFDQSEALVDQTYDYLAGGDIPASQLTLDARVAAMDEELAEMFRDEMREYYDYTDQELEAMGTILMVEPRDFTAVRIFCGVGAVSLLLGAALLVLRWKKESARLSQAQEPVSGPEIQ